MDVEIGKHSCRVTAKGRILFIEGEGGRKVFLKT